MTSFNRNISNHFRATWTEYLAIFINIWGFYFDKVKKTWVTVHLKSLAWKMDSKGVNKYFHLKKDLLECPVCFHTIDSVPIYQCLNGHVICKNCHPKLETCPICRDGQISLRNLKLEEIVKRYLLIFCSPDPLPFPTKYLLILHFPWSTMSLFHGCNLKL